MKSKKLPALVLSAVMLFSLTACLQNNAPATSGGNTTTAAQPSGGDAASTTPAALPR